MKQKFIKNNYKDSRCLVCNGWVKVHDTLIQWIQSMLEQEFRTPWWFLFSLECIGVRVGWTVGLRQRSVLGVRQEKQFWWLSVSWVDHMFSDIACGVTGGPCLMHHQRCTLDSHAEDGLGQLIFFWSFCVRVRVSHNLCKFSVGQGQCDSEYQTSYSFVYSLSFSKWWWYWYWTADFTSFYSIYLYF